MSDDAEPIGDAGFDEWIEAIEDGTPFALECPNGHGSLPPRRVCPHCGDGDLEEVPLPTEGVLKTMSEVHVPTPQFTNDAPYTLAIAAFGPVRITGQLRGVPHDEIAIGDRVTVDVDRRRTTGDPLVVFDPV